SEDTAAAAGVFTTNVVKGHSLQVTLENIKSGYANAIVINSGNANACIGPVGYENAKEIASLTASLLDCGSDKVLLGSTGVIGQPLDMEKIRSGIQAAVENMSPDGGKDAATAIMTTDLITKQIAVEIEIKGTKVKIGGMAKGSGMIHPNMATMIGIITTDADISKKMLQKALKDCTKKTFNRISVDGDTSVCDMVLILANGQSENEAIMIDDAGFAEFRKALEFVCSYLSKLIVQDGEGATKFIEILAKNALNEDDAYKIACTVAKSPLVKTAIFGEDANWGRILTAAGYSGANFDPSIVDIYIGDLLVCENGNAVAFDEVVAKNILSKKEIKIILDLKQGNHEDRMWTCDFSYDYIKINGNYRS
ncbi:MAG: bifunctional glutamate N-acetyltransferase/amino-acid acetyltransferase ArgJ, partial [Vallitaleaceae bacterium]|nr:bifunctional glutamate N-acetyltransferase/amino-acid acetyltransferase ArgJ [Vallitaleaceae bacterium]